MLQCCSDAVLQSSLLQSSQLHSTDTEVLSTAMSCSRDRVRGGELSPHIIAAETDRDKGKNRDIMQK